jgi:hypothetical protein
MGQRGKQAHHPAFDAGNFGGPIDNRWLPLKPGTVLRYSGFALLDTIHSPSVSGSSG